MSGLLAYLPSICLFGFAALSLYFQNRFYKERRERRDAQHFIWTFHLMFRSIGAPVPEPRFPDPYPNCSCRKVFSFSFHEEARQDVRPS